VNIRAYKETALQLVAEELGVLGAPSPSDTAGGAMARKKTAAVVEKPVERTGFSTVETTR